MASKTLGELEKKAYELIKSQGEQGLLQSELWKKMNIDSREGSRITLQLLKKGLIVREPVVHNGRRTYKLYAVKRYDIVIKINLDSVKDIPCFTCRYFNRCGIGNYYDPRTCPILTEWLIRQAGNGSASKPKMRLREN